MISYTPTPRYDYLEEVTATKINKALAGKLKASNKQIVKSLRRKSVESIKPI